MSLDLDERQRAMLLEMGVRVWSPRAELPAAAESTVVQPVQAAPSVARPPTPVVSVRTEVAIENIAIEAISTRAGAQKHLKTPALSSATAMPATLADGAAALDWPTLALTVASCQACKLCVGRRAPVFGAANAAAAPAADWLVVGEPPDEAEERAGLPLVDQAGQLLDNMLRAVGVRRCGVADAGSRASAAYVTNVVKCRPGVVRNPAPQELATCANYLQREVALVQPRVILAMGRFAAQTLLRDSVPDVVTIPLGKLRGQVYRYQGIPVVVTYHPTYLLRTQHDKARAWADLCLALHAVS